MQTEDWYCGELLKVLQVQVSEDWYRGELLKVLQEVLQVQATEDWYRGELLTPVLQVTVQVEKNSKKKLKNKSATEKPSPPKGTP
jgi:hypothetical protein